MQLLKIIYRILLNQFKLGHQNLIPKILEFLRPYFPPQSTLLINKH
jgi:hypothetical protein